MIYVLFGKSGSGKSYVGEWLQQTYGFLHFDADSLLTPEMRNFIKHEKNFTQEMVDDFTEQLIKKIRVLRQDQNSPIVISQALYRTKNRKQLQNRYPDLTFILINASDNTCLQRVRDRENSITEDYAKMMLPYFQYPDSEEHYHTVNNDANGYEHLVNQLDRLIDSYQIENNLTVRSATINDTESIMQIYNQAIATTTATFDLEPKSLAEISVWLKDAGATSSYLVIESQQQVIAWGVIKSWSDRKAYAKTGEITLYVDSKFQGRGVGQRLMMALLDMAKSKGYHTILSRITAGNDTSIYLHQKFGFDMVGVMREVGIKFNKKLDVYLLQKMLV